MDGSSGLSTLPEVHFPSSFCSICSHNLSHVLHKLSQQRLRNVPLLTIICSFPIIFCSIRENTVWCVPHKITVEICERLQPPAACRRGIHPSQYGGCKKKTKVFLCPSKNERHSFKSITSPLRRGRI